MKRPQSVTRMLLCAAVLVLAGCAATPAPEPATGPPPASDLLQVEPWPEADALFHSDPKWLGSDDAYSVDLGGGRTLWLFGDTFISRTFLHPRRLATMIRNSAAIQSGYDPSAASLDFYWRTQRGKPMSFFPDEDETWFWPGHGIVLQGKLFLFFMATQSAPEGIGFQHVGWRAVSITDPGQPPSAWQLTWLEMPDNRYGLLVSGSVLQEGEYLLAYSVKEPEHTIHLVRWPVAQVLEDDLTRPQWWMGEEGGWVVQQELAGVPYSLFSEGHNEFTVHYEPGLDRYLEIQSVGFGAADLGFRLSDRPAGWWAPLELFYRVEEHPIPGILIYAAKAHPQLEGAGLVLTYATNIAGYERLVARTDLYYPRFLKATLDGPGGAGSP